MSGTSVELYHSPVHHVQPSYPHYAGDVISTSTNPISTIVQSIISKEDVQYSEIQNLPKNVSKSMKIDILHPLTGDWERVSLDDIRYLQGRNLNTTHINQLLTKVSIARATEIAKEIPEEKGEKLVIKILTAASTTNAAGGLCSSVFKVLKFLFFTHAVLPMKAETSFRSDEEPIKSNNVLSLSEVEVETETMWHWIHKLKQDNIQYVLYLRALSKGDYLYLKNRGLTHEHFQELYLKQVTVQQVIGVSYVFPNLKKDELMEKIVEALQTPKKSQAFQRWEKNLFTSCSRNGLKDAAPKALVLISEDYYAKVNEIDVLSFQRISEIYNTCVSRFRTMKEFAKAIGSHTDIQLLSILGSSNAEGWLTLDKEYSYKFPVTYLSSLFGNHVKYSSLFSKHLNPKAHVVFISSFAGKGKENNKNWANFIYLNSPPGVQVFAPTQEIYSLQQLWTKDTKGFLVANFWNYRNVSVINENTVFENIRDDSYVVNSKTQLSKEVLSEAPTWTETFIVLAVSTIFVRVIFLRK